jgi:general stress protein YciG
MTVEIPNPSYKISRALVRDGELTASPNAILKASQTEDSSRKMTVQEAGRRGGLTTLDNQGRAFFSRIGKKGGKRTAQLYRELLSEFGKQGGRPRRLGPEEYTGKEGQL